LTVSPINHMCLCGTDVGRGQSSFSIQLLFSPHRLPEIPLDPLPSINKKGPDRYGCVNVDVEALALAAADAGAAPQGAVGGGGVVAAAV